MIANKRILIVDDQQDLREHMAKMLSNVSRKNSSGASLVQQMRSRLLGNTSAMSDKEENKTVPEDDYQVDTAGQGQDALAMVEKALAEARPYALMFLDMRMPPGWDGLETAKRIREIDKRIEIVIMTAYADHDQASIAKAVGQPEKLLYIKKPFQTEEIFQLALCLTSKWNAEEAELQRKAWLESLVRGMSRIKSDKDKNVPATVLASLLTFTGAKKGFIVSLNEESRTWKLEYNSEMEPAEADACVKENKDRIFDNKTTLCLENKFFLPLKREGYSAVAVVYSVSAPNDPEWYKLLSLLVMTASEVLCSESLADEMNRKEKTSTLTGACSMIASDFITRLMPMLEKARQLKDEGLISDLKTMIRRTKYLERYGENVVPVGFETCDVLILFQEALSDFEKESDDTVRFAKDPVSEGDSFMAYGIPSLIRETFLLLCRGLASFAEIRKKRIIAIKLSAEKNGKNRSFLIECDLPYPDDSELRDLFDPFTEPGNNRDCFGLCFPLARRLIKSLNGSLFFDSAYRNGQRFTITLPSEK